MFLLLLASGIEKMTYMPFALDFSVSCTRSAKHVGVADVFVVRHAACAGFYITSWTFDGIREKTDIPFILIFTAHLGFVRHTIYAGFL